MRKALVRYPFVVGLAVRLVLAVLLPWMLDSGRFIPGVAYTDIDLYVDMNEQTEQTPHTHYAIIPAVHYLTVMSIPMLHGISNRVGIHLIGPHIAIRPFSPLSWLDSRPVNPPGTSFVAPTLSVVG